MLTEKDIEHIEEYIRGNLDANTQAELKDKIAADPIYKNKYDELLVLSEAIQKYEKHKHVFEKIKAKRNEGDVSQDHLFKTRHQSGIANQSYNRQSSICSDAEPLATASRGEGSDGIVNFNKYFNRRNFSIAASVAILIGIGFYTNNTSDNNIQEYGSPENAITDSLELDSLDIKQDSLPELKQYFD